MPRCIRPSIHPATDISLPSHTCSSRLSWFWPPAAGYRPPVGGWSEEHCNTRRHITSARSAFLQFVLRSSRLQHVCTCVCGSLQLLTSAAPQQQAGRRTGGPPTCTGGHEECGMNKTQMLYLPCVIYPNNNTNNSCNCCAHYINVRVSLSDGLEVNSRDVSLSQRVRK